MNSPTASVSRSKNSRSRATCGEFSPILSSTRTARKPFSSAPRASDSSVSAPTRARTWKRPLAARSTWNCLCGSRRAGRTTRPCCASTATNKRDHAACRRFQRRVRVAQLPVSRNQSDCRELYALARPYGVRCQGRQASRQRHERGAESVPAPVVQLVRQGRNENAEIGRTWTHLSPVQRLRTDVGDLHE